MCIFTKISKSEVMKYILFNYTYIKVIPVIYFMYRSKSTEVQ